MNTENLDQLRDLADSMDCFIPEDVRALAGITESTLEAWRKRGQGPQYVQFGNRPLYPKHALKKFLADRVRQGRSAGDLL